jgi:hypothetical protein
LNPNFNTKGERSMDVLAFGISEDLSPWPPPALAAARFRRRLRKLPAA